jgi:hypothetical protein
MPMRLIIVLTAALLGSIFAPVSIAQMRGATMSVPGGAGYAGFARNIGFSNNGFSNNGFSNTSVSFAGPRSRSFGPGAIFLGDPFYADYLVAPVTIPPQFVIVQPVPAADTPPEAKSEPLLIELQGSRYVRFGGRQQSAERATTAPLDYAEAGARNAPGIAPTSQAELPTAVLIFKDGHREQVPEYAIVGSTIYASADYWQTGHWTKNIELSSLDIPATVQANNENGIKFKLPSAPNEVITRP